MSEARATGSAQLLSVVPSVSASGVDTHRRITSAASISTDTALSLARMTSRKPDAIAGVSTSDGPFKSGRYMVGFKDVSTTEKDWMATTQDLLAKTLRKDQNQIQEGIRDESSFYLECAG